MDHALVRLADDAYNHAFLEAMVTGELRMFMPGLFTTRQKIDGARGQPRLRGGQLLHARAPPVRAPAAVPRVPLPRPAPPRAHRHRLGVSSRGIHPGPALDAPLRAAGVGDRERDRRPHGHPPERRSSGGTGPRCSRRGPRASTCAATSTGRCWTTSSGSRAGGRASACTTWTSPRWSDGRRRPATTSARSRWSVSSGLRARLPLPAAGARPGGRHRLEVLGPHPAGLLRDAAVAVRVALHLVHVDVGFRVHRAEQRLEPAEDLAEVGGLLLLHVRPAGDADLHEEGGLSGDRRGSGRR